MVLKEFNEWFDSALAKVSDHNKQAWIRGVQDYLRFEQEQMDAEYQRKFHETL